MRILFESDVAADEFFRETIIPLYRAAGAMTAVNSSLVAIVEKVAELHLNSYFDHYHLQRQIRATGAERGAISVARTLGEFAARTTERRRKTGGKK